MFKKGFFYIAIFLMTLTGAGCSSSSDSGEDLDISEIKEIEATGEFSEDEFFSANSEGDIVEEKLVDEVPDLDSEIGEGVAQIEDSEGDDLAEDLNIDDSIESTDVAKLDGSDIFDDLGDENLDEGSNVGGTDVTITADDLDIGEDEGDIFSDDAGLGDTTVADASGGDALELENEEDLFRDDELDLDEPSDVQVSTDDTIDEDSSADLSFADADVEVDTDKFVKDKPASQTLAEDVSIDVDYSDQVVSDKSASQLLAEDDVSIDDIAYSQDAAKVNVASSGARGLVPVRKMQTVPYSKNGVLINAIYFVRAGDTLSSIGNKIYGNGSAVDFKLVNSHLKPGALKVGQKVYYNSPNRSQDRSRLLTYYEDVRIPAKIYSASKGENIRTVAQNLLGHPRSWMEVWASNQQIEEKWALTAPYQIRYWEGQQTAIPALARNTTPTPPPSPAPTAPKPISKIEPAKEVVAKNQPAGGTTNQASLNLDEGLDEPADLEDDIFDDPVAADDESVELDEPADVAALDEPVEIDDGFDDGFDGELDEPAEVKAAQNNNLNGKKGAQNGAAVAAVDGRGIARNQGFPAKSVGFLKSPMMKQGIIGISLLLLLVVGYLVIKRRRESKDAIEMESFDFGGETVVDEAQTKTQIDL